ncbi:conserved hypothetical protein [Tenacibaculum maritimum]|nr:conserved hypothetical protein [Tenacibaculum maritimum]
MFFVKILKVVFTYKTRSFLNVTYYFFIMALIVQFGIVSAQKRRNIKKRIMKKLVYLFLSLFMLTSCATQKNMIKDTIWVNSTRVTCTGVVPMSCLETQLGRELIPNKWEFFYDEIEGFTYESGYIYKLRISIENLNEKEIPADGSNKRYQLIEVISKTPDAKLRLQDVWVATRINGRDIQLKEEDSRPRIEIEVGNKNILGKGACNRFFGSIETLTGKKITFSKIGATKMMCLDMNLEDLFFDALQSVKTYKIENSELHLFDENKEVLHFKKID